MTTKNKIRINSELHRERFNNKLKERQQQYILGAPITNQFKINTNIIYVCPHCGTTKHEDNYEFITDKGVFYCSKCHNTYQIPKEKTIKWSPPNSLTDKIYIENPDWIK